MKNSLKFTTFLIGSLGIATTSHAVINFETIGPIVGDNGTLSTAQTFTDGGATFRFGVDANGLTDGLSLTNAATIEQVGFGDGASGFIYDQAVPDPIGPPPYPADIENPNLGSIFAGRRADSLDNYFLRTDPVGSGGNILDGDAVFLIQYDTTGVFEASGQIWDIDGGLPSPGSEQYTVRAYDAALNLLDTDISPLGTTNGSDLSTSLDGLPWLFTITSITNDIKYISIDFTGSKTTNIGLAFDNFDATAVPEPSAFALILGIAALAGAMNRRRRS